ncbi:amidase [Streptomyces cocklensis]|uniref:Aspartyl-tRNA(Asn) amidotransferase subunit A n=1 Tax=Actinacidiphila cocklensis TaxID=887465 RepID=A0A9W4E518_9ACTN|nr:amidase [Actinacidiphila cocklensis]MDD1057975.1 amidase [Actinacidiphila cocklensis]CAG6392987.1 Aspartyl-tRNA(Asn) amidotransferase subunit A [Actinacidiphila cocklensis]
MPEERVTSPGATPATGFSRRAVLGGAAAVTGAAAVSAAVATPAAADPGSDSVPSAAARLLGALPAVSAIKKRSRLVDYEVVELAALMRARVVTAVQVTTAYLDRIDRFNGPFETYGDNGLYNAFVRIDREGALAQAAAADARFARARHTHEDLPPLLGIPFGVKDSVAVKGLEAKDGSHAFDGNAALRDATAVHRLREAGAVILGHTVASAFSGSITGTFAGNAWNKAYVPGGSSQGSGVAPVARLAAAAIGEETGGSIMMPSAANGASGIKPSLGTTSVAGLMPLSPGYDVLGPIARSVRDASLILSVILGPDPANDPLTLSAPDPFPAMPLTARKGRSPLAGTTIGIPQTDWMRTSRGIQTGTSPQDTYDADHLAAFTRLKDQLTSLGATVKEFPGLDVTVPANDPYFSSTDVLATVDGSPVSPSSAVLSPNRYEIRYWDAVKDFAATRPADQAAALLAQYGRKAPGETAASFESASRFAGQVPAAVRVEGEHRRRTLQANYQAALDAAGVDFMLVFSLGAQIGLRTGGGFPVYRAYYQLPNALAWPMVSFPVGYDSTVGLPIAAQFWGPRFSEPQIVQAAIDYQEHFPQYHNAAPPDPDTTAAKVAPRMLRSAEPATPPELSNDPLVAEEALR